MLWVLQPGTKCRCGVRLSALSWQSILSALIAWHVTRNDGLKTDSGITKYSEKKVMPVPLGPPQSTVTAEGLKHCLGVGKCRTQGADSVMGQCIATSTGTDIMG